MTTTAPLFAAIRRVESETGRPIGILADMQGPKLRLGNFAGGKVSLAAGDKFRLDLAKRAGDRHRAPLPHPEVFAALQPGTELLIDDGKVRLKVTECGKDFAETECLVGGALSNHKGVNVPHVVLPISAVTDKDRADLSFALEHGADWIALSFVQRPEDVAEGRKLIGNARRADGQAGEAVGDPPARRDHRARRRADGGARRPRRRDAAGRRAERAEADHPRLPPCRKAGDRRDADAGIDDHRADCRPAPRRRTSPPRSMKAPTR